MKIGDYSELFDILESSSSGSVSIVTNLISLVVWVLMIIAQWKIFEKAGEHGWAALIPYYRDYILYKVSGKKKLFVWYLLCSIFGIVFLVVFAVSYVLMLVELITAGAGDAIAGYGLVMGLSFLLMCVGAIAVFVFKILQCIGLSKNFGLGGGFAAGLIFLPAIFYCILAFSNSYAYLGFTGSYAAGSYGYQDAYGQYGYGNPQYGSQTQYGSPQYGGQTQYGSPQYGSQAQYGNQPYGNQAQYGNQPYDNQNGYSDPHYGNKNS